MVMAVLNVFFTCKQTQTSVFQYFGLKAELSISNGSCKDVARIWFRERGGGASTNPEIIGVRLMILYMNPTSFATLRPPGYALGFLAFGGFGYLGYAHENAAVVLSHVEVEHFVVRPQLTTLGQLPGEPWTHSLSPKFERNCFVNGTLKSCNSKLSQIAKLLFDNSGNIKEVVHHVVV